MIGNFLSYQIFIFAIPPSFTIGFMLNFIPFCGQGKSLNKSDNYTKEAEFLVSKLSHVSYNTIKYEIRFILESQAFPS